MSNLLSCKSLVKAFGAQTLFRDVDLIINSGDRIGLIGPNGSGKSTLLKIICGMEEADSGEILAAKHLRIGYLAQTDIFEDNLSVYDNLHLSLTEQDLDDVEKHNKVHAMLSRAEFVEDNTPVRYLSGGWRKRLAICRALLTAPHVLVLDEPTNHLDIEGIIWLEKLLSGGLTDGPSAFLLVSHDRQFLENCSNRIIELSAIYQQGSFQVNGSYTTFLEKRKNYLLQQAQVEDRLSNKVRRETEWLQRGPKARTSKARYRIDEAYRLKDELAQVKGRNKAGSQVRIDFGGTGRKTKKLLEARELTKSYDGKELFSNLDMLLSPGTRLGLLGCNGCGKSTLMEVLAGGDDFANATLDKGRIVTADNVKIISFDQKRESLDQSITLRRALAPEGDSVVFRERSVHVVSWAKRFLFRADQLETPVSELSGGEQARILIASLMLKPADILLLDEPTNDLDIGSLDVLEESLLDFPGALVLVTHDRFLLNRVCDRVLGFDGEGGVTYYADYQQWLTDLTAKKKSSLQPFASGKTDKAQVGKNKNKPGKLSYLDQREYDQLEGKIMEAEELQEELQQKLDSTETAADPVKLSKYWQEMEQLTSDIEGLYRRWEELEEKKMSG